MKVNIIRATIRANFHTDRVSSRDCPPPYTGFKSDEASSLRFFRPNIKLFKIIKALFNANKVV